MRTKKPTLFFTFPSTEAAMEAERICMQAQVPGRLVPIPRQITAGCGLAWMTEPEHAAQLRAFFAAQGLHYENSVVIDF